MRTISNHDNRAQQVIQDQGLEKFRYLSEAAALLFDNKYREFL